MLQLRSESDDIKTAHFTVAAATTSKTPVVVNTRAFIPLDDAGANEANGFVYRSEISDGDKAAGVALAVGDPIYWDPANGNFTNVSNAGANTLCGHAIEAALAGDAVTGLIAFNSFAA